MRAMDIVCGKDWNAIHSKSLFKHFTSKTSWLSSSTKLGMGGPTWFPDLIKHLIIGAIMDKQVTFFQRRPHL